MVKYYHKERLLSIRRRFIVMKRYTVGVDFGTLSARCTVLDTVSGETVFSAVMEYPHGVMSDALPDGTKLPSDFALQHPSDYVEALSFTVREALTRARISPTEVGGIGIDFTACTMLAVDGEGVPLCLTPEFQNEPHAYVKLWKHHGAAEEADRINALAKEKGEEWLGIYGGKISCEWMQPKIMETLRCAPEVFYAADRFTEAADWLSWLLTGKETHSVSFAGYKALYNAETGYPSDSFMTALDSRLHGIVGTKISTEVYGMDKSAGVLNKKGAEITGLDEGTALSLPIIDAHASMPALGIDGEGVLMLILGTSGCHIINSAEKRNVPGSAGYVKDAVIPGYYTYEAGQAALGDIFDWFVKTSVPSSYFEEAKEKGIGIHKLLREKAKGLSVGESGLVALDWHNGNRSPLSDSSLSGLILGMTLSTKPEEMYRAWLEATAYGTRMIIENFESNGIPVRKIVASGGIAKKDELMMQIFADVTRRTIEVSDSEQSAALGSAIAASVAAGIYPSMKEAIVRFKKAPQIIYTPIPENSAAYEKLFSEYKELHEYFGKQNSVMKRLKTK